jgi:hypothetical protein
MTRRVMFFGLAALAVRAEPARLVKGPQWMEIVLERNDSGAWRTIDAGLVLNRDDLVRFRFRTNFGGYLYVINSGTSGSRSLLFPGEESGTKNKFAASTDYVIPATEAAFRVSGPPGHDVVYWLVSPVPLSENPVGAFLREQGSTSPKTLLPRCDDSIFRARGQCIDSSAGPRNLAAADTLLDSVPALPHAGQRDLVIVQDRKVARVSAPESLTGPVIYEFRLAHR